jgi:V/A-type H+-transporting ATPase subunit C
MQCLGKIRLQTTKYASVLPKIGAERSKLLSETKLKALSESKSLSEVASQLRDSGYQEQISHLPVPLTGRKLERAFNENLIETYLKIVEYSPEQAVRYLDLYLSRFELENIKTLIRAASAKLSVEQRLSRIYLSVEKYFRHVAFMEEAAKAPAVTQVVSAFRNTEYHSALAMGLKSYQESGSTTIMDIFVDALFYEKLYAAYQSLPKKEKPHAEFYAAAANDSFALLTLLRGKNLNYDPNWLRLAIPNRYFHLGKNQVESIVSALDFEAAYKIVQSSYYGKYFHRAVSPEQTVAGAEKAFRESVLRYAIKGQVRETFNIGSTLGFITRKEAEVHNLTAIGLGVEGGLKPEVIRDQLLL